MGHRVLVIAVMLLAAACGDDDAATTVPTTVAATVATTGVVTMPTTVSETTVAEPTTTPTTVVETTTTTVPLSYEMTPFGLYTPVAELWSSVWLTTEPSVLVSYGAFDYPGPLFTVALDGFVCGTGSTIGPLAGIAVGEFKEAPAFGSGERLVELVTSDPRVISSLGVKVGWTETDMLATLGPASSEPGDPYLESPTHRWYVYLDAGNPGYGLRFRVDVSTGLVDEVASGLADHLGGVLMCNV